MAITQVGRYNVCVFARNLLFIAALHFVGVRHVTADSSSVCSREIPHIRVDPQCYVDYDFIESGIRCSYSCDEGYTNSKTVDLIQCAFGRWITYPGFDPIGDLCTLGSNNLIAAVVAPIVGCAYIAVAIVLICLYRSRQLKGRSGTGSTNTPRVIQQNGTGIMSRDTQPNGTRIISRDTQPNGTRIISHGTQPNGTMQSNEQVWYTSARQIPPPHMASSQQVTNTTNMNISPEHVNQGIPNTEDSEIPTRTYRTRAVLISVHLGDPLEARDRITLPPRQTSTNIAPPNYTTLDIQEPPPSYEEAIALGFI